MSLDEKAHACEYIWKQNVTLILIDGTDLFFFLISWNAPLFPFFVLNTHNHKEDVNTHKTCCSCCGWLSKATKTKSECVRALELLCSYFLFTFNTWKSRQRPLFLPETHQRTLTFSRVRMVRFVTGLNARQTVKHSRKKKNPQLPRTALCGLQMNHHGLYEQAWEKC